MRKIKNNVKNINESWAPMINGLGVTDPSKVEWMSKMAHFNAMALNEADGAAGAAFPGGSVQQNAGAMGATVLVAVGLGICNSIEDAKKMIPVSKTFTPNMETKKIYDKYYEVYKNLYSSNKKNFAALNS